MSENQPTGKPESEPARGKASASEKPARPDTAAEPARTSRPAELKRLLDLELPIIAVMGSKTMSLKDVVSLTAGSIIQLDKPAADSLDLMVNDQCIGQGQVVRVGDNFGLRITRLGPVDETIRKLGRGAGASEKPADPPAEDPDVSTDT